MKRQQIVQLVINIVIALVLIAIAYVIFEYLFVYLVSRITTPPWGPEGTRSLEERNSASYWSGADIGITRYYISHTAGSSMMVIRNNRLFAVNVTGVSVGGAWVFGTTIPLPPGSSTNITLNGSVPSCTAGNSYSMTTIVNYSDAVNGTIYSFTGAEPLVGTCEP